MDNSEDEDSFELPSWFNKKEPEADTIPNVSEEEQWKDFKLYIPSIRIPIGTTIPYVPSHSVGLGSLGTLGGSLGVDPSVVTDTGYPQERYNAYKKAFPQGYVEVKEPTKQVQPKYTELKGFKKFIKGVIYGPSS